MAPRPHYAVDPDDPRAPPQALWDQLDEAARRALVDSLPSEFPVRESAPPEGDPHFEAKVRVRDVLRRYFGRRPRGVYVGNELAVYYPNEAMFAPDVLVVLDVDPHARQSWIVSAEGKGIDLALEIHVSGRRTKDVRDNARRFARLGIREYFVFEVRRSRLLGFRLEGADISGYQPVLAQDGLYRSEVLGLDIAVEGERLRFYHDLALLPEAHELIARLQGAVNEMAEKREHAEREAEEESRRANEESRRADEESLRAQGESRRADEQSRRADEESARASDEAARRRTVEERLAEALLEIERLKRGP